MSQTRQHSDHYGLADQMRAAPGEWVLVSRPTARGAAISQVQRIRGGVHKAYRRGRFEARHDRDLSGAPQVWARYLGEVTR